MQGPNNPINRSGLPNSRNIKRAAEYQYAWNNATTPWGQAFQVTADGVQLVDQKPKPILAIINLGGGSGRGGSGKEALPANDQSNAYEWNEGFWKVVNDDFTVIALPGGRSGTFYSYPAIERNGSTDVPHGYVTWLKPAFADGNWFYEFTFNGESGNGSGIPITITCSDGSHHTATISGDNITVS